MNNLIKVTYQPPKGETWVKEVPEAQAEKMVKLGRWKYAPVAETKKDFSKKDK